VSPHYYKRLISSDHDAKTIPPANNSPDLLSGEPQPVKVRAGCSQKPRGICSSDQCLLVAREAEQPDFVKFEFRVKPGTVGAEQDLAGPCTSDSLYYIVEAPHSSRIAVDVGIAYKLINNLLMSAPVVAKATEVGDDEINIWIFGSEHVNYRWLGYDVDQHRQA
jgi:hypothetical protein